MISLGINIGHDRGAAIIKDGELVGAISQERVDRIKHSPSIDIPFQAIDSIIKYLNISFKDINYIGISSTAVDAKDLVKFYRDKLIAYYRSCDFQLIPVSHHLSHALAAYNTSDFDDAIIIVADGGGEVLGIMEEAESIFIGKGTNVTLVEQRLQNSFMHPMSRAHNYLYPFMNKELIGEQVSIGRKYEQITKLIGFGSHGEGKTMGLSPYGKETIKKEITPLTDINFDLKFGDFVKEIDQLCINQNTSYDIIINNKKSDIALSIQQFAEKQIIEIIRYAVNKYGIKNICLSGGVFLNCPINHKILETFNDIKLHICPASGDEGQCIGNAYAAFKASGLSFKNSNRTLPFLGISYNNNRIEESLKQKNLKYRFLEENELASIIAKEIYKNKIIGLFYSRSEIGPRALCHRSILANPCSSGMKDYLNHKVKHREKFRPFAPSVMQEYQFDYFDLLQESPYMLLAAQVKEKYKKIIPAVTHIDGSARIQAVKKEDNSLVYHILEEFRKLSGVPIVLNTSFNDNGEPIVETPEDAIKTFLLTNIDILVLNNFIVFKNGKT